MQKLLALNQRQKMVKHLSFKILYEVVIKSPLSLLINCQVLQRKNEETSMASNRLKNLLESRKVLLSRKTGWNLPLLDSLCFSLLVECINLISFCKISSRDQKSLSCWNSGAMIRLLFHFFIVFFPLFSRVKYIVSGNCIHADHQNFHYYILLCYYDSI